MNVKLYWIWMFCDSSSFSTWGLAHLMSHVIAPYHSYLTSSTEKRNKLLHWYWYISHIIFIQGPMTNNLQPACTFQWLYQGSHEYWDQWTTQKMERALFPHFSKIPLRCQKFLDCDAAMCGGRIWPRLLPSSTRQSEIKTWNTGEMWDKPPVTSPAVTYNDMTNHTAQSTVAAGTTEIIWCNIFLFPSCNSYNIIFIWIIWHPESLSS